MLVQIGLLDPAKLPVVGVESAKKVLDPSLPANELMKRAEPITQHRSDKRIQIMSIVGKVESLWRYPVKSMRGEELEEAFAGYPGVYGDRVFAFKSSASPRDFRISRRASSGDFCNIGPGFVILTKPRAP